MFYNRFIKESVFLLIFTGTIFLYIYSYSSIPIEVPAHWDLSGQPTSYMHKNILLGIYIGLYFILYLLSFIPSLIKSKKYPHSIDNNYFYSIRILIHLMISEIPILTILYYKGIVSNIIAVIIGSILIMYICIGFIVPKFDSNYLIGIRLPWIMNDTALWKRTNKIGGIFLMIFSALGLIVIFLLKKHYFIIFIIISIISFLFNIIYSLIIFKTEKF